MDNQDAFIFKTLCKSIVIIVVSFSVIVFVAVISAIFMYNTGNNTNKETPVLYLKEVQVEVTDSKKEDKTKDGTPISFQRITVRNEEYNLEKVFEVEDAKYQKIKKGDKITANLGSWRVKSTGAVEKTDIYSLK